MNATDLDNLIGRLRIRNDSNTRLANIYEWLFEHAVKHWNDKTGYGKKLFQAMTYASRKTDLKTGYGVIQFVWHYADPKKPELDQNIARIVNYVRHQPAGDYDIPGVVHTSTTYGLFKIVIQNQSASICKASKKDLINYLCDLKPTVAQFKGVD